MSLPLSVFGIALAAAGLCVLFQKSSPAFAFLLSLGAAVIPVSYTHLTLPTN